MCDKNVVLRCPKIEKGNIHHECDKKNFCIEVRDKCVKKVGIEGDIGLHLCKPHCNDKYVSITFKYEVFDRDCGDKRVLYCEKFTRKFDLHKYLYVPVGRRVKLKCKSDCPVVKVSLDCVVGNCSNKNLLDKSCPTFFDYTLSYE